MPDEPATPDDGAKDEADSSKGHLKRKLLPLLMRYSTSRRALGVHTIYRDTGGSLLSAGLAYAALFALIPAMALVVAGLYILLDDPSVRDQAIDTFNSAFPALEGFTAQTIEGGKDVAAAGSIIAIIGFGWAASGLYVSLTRAMERFFPGERVSGVLARVLGVLLVLFVIVGVVAAVFVAGVVTVIARALEIDAEWLLAVIGALVTLALATGLAYGIYRVMPSAPPAPSSARLPALLVGSVIGLMTLLYGLMSPWLVSGFQMFGVAASFFVALVWLRLVFLAMMYGAAMARYRDHVAIAARQGSAEPDAAATRHVLESSAERAAQGAKASAEVLEAASEYERSSVADEDD